MSKDQQQLRDQVTRLGRKRGSPIEAVRKETRQAGENLFYTVQTQIERQMESIKSRVAALETARDADKAQIAALQEK